MESYQVFFVTGLSLLESNHNRHELFLGFHMFIYMNDKVRIFREGHKILQNLHRRFVLCSNSQILGGDFAKFCVLLRIYEFHPKSRSIDLRYNQ